MNNEMCGKVRALI